MPPKIKSKATQDIIPIKEIRDGVTVLKDGSLRMLMMTSSINFALKSNEEQEALLMQYQNFLNSLDFSVQFFIQSKKLNIEPYLETLRQKEKEQTEELLKIQIKEYIEFVKEFVNTTNIVNKNFYISVPYTPSFLETKDGGLAGKITSIFSSGTKNETEAMTQEKIEKYKNQLQQRVDTVAQGLAGIGIRTAPLNTEELIELFYNLYNPGEEERPKINSTPAL